MMSRLTNREILWIVLGYKKIIYSLYRRIIKKSVQISKSSIWWHQLHLSQIRRNKKSLYLLNNSMTLITFSMNARYRSISSNLIPIPRQSPDGYNSPHQNCDTSSPSTRPSAGPRGRSSPAALATSHLSRSNFHQFPTFLGSSIRSHKVKRIGL